jgi:uncharacterized membrane protein
MPVAESLESRQLFAAELVPEVVGVLPPAAIGGQKVKAGALVTIRNQGDATAAGRTNIELFLSVDHTFDNTDIALPPTSVKLNLRPGRAKTFRLRIRTLPLANDAEYHLAARVNATGEIAEGNLFDNTFVDQNAHVQLARPRMDLAAAFAQVPATLRPGKSATVSVNVFNSANIVAAGRLNFQLAASADVGTDPTGQPLAVASPRIKIAPDGLRTLKLKFRVPANFPAGTYTLLGTVDSTNAFEESDETNNLFPAFSTVAIG